MRFGLNWHGAWSVQTPEVRAATLDAIKAMGADHVRLDFAWATIEPRQGAFEWSKLDQLIGEADARGLKVLVMLYWPPFWSSGTGTATSPAKNGQPRKGADFGTVLGQVGKRYGDKLLGIEMWNEPDLDTFWASRDPVPFATMIKGAYPVAKAAAPNTTFVLGAPTYLGLAPASGQTKGWLERLYVAGIKGYFDALAIHPYPSPAHLPPSAEKTKWSIAGITDVRALMSTFGDKSPIWATEFGWSTHSNEMYSRTSQPWKMGVTEEEQAKFLVDAIPELERQGVAVATAYTDRDMASSDVHEAKFGILGKPAQSALTAALKPPPDPHAECQATINAMQARIGELTADNDDSHRRLVEEQARTAAAQRSEMLLRSSIQEVLDR